jgi:NTP pyrophosphatase (non-canonical NTP hydrolase)
MQLTNEFNSIREWANERGLYEKGDAKTQYIKLQEEAGELARALLKKDEPEIKDAIGDCIVVLTNLAVLCDLKIEECINSSYQVIKNRTGKMNNGTFVKSN